jgi:hypothetical protein
MKKLEPPVCQQVIITLMSPLIDYNKHERMAKGSHGLPQVCHGLPQVSPGPAMPYPSTLLRPMGGPPIERAACGRLLPLWTTPSRTPMITSHDMMELTGSGEAYMVGISVFVYAGFCSLIPLGFGGAESQRSILIAPKLASVTDRLRVSLNGNQPLNNVAI